MEQTTRKLDNELVRRCMERTGIKTQDGVIDYALRELLRRENQMKILQLKGRIHWEGNLEAWRQRCDA
ncbi:MAG: type II toxin-antitoxin system VapB family antitoxin [Candidatus Electrothrix sp. MAN1_4]|nr:type II toxin-antitoxin system VapB family antitoxin [Candidatus Electrothrix sp. MAN1_4]